MTLKTGSAAFRAADQIVKEGQPQRITERFEIYKVPDGDDLDGFALLLFKEGQWFLPGKVPKAIMIPVSVGKLTGYFIPKLLASTYND
jgi:hypothetical protein